MSGSQILINMFQSVNKLKWKLNDMNEHPLVQPESYDRMTILDFFREGELRGPSIHDLQDYLRIIKNDQTNRLGLRGDYEQPVGE